MQLLMIVFVFSEVQSRGGFTLYWKKSLKITKG